MNDDYSLIFKRILNYYISYEYREKVLDKLMKKFVPNEKEILQSYYLTKKQIIEMHQCRNDYWITYSKSSSNVKT